MMVSQHELHSTVSTQYTQLTRLSSLKGKEEDVQDYQWSEYVNLAIVRDIVPLSMVGICYSRNCPRYPAIVSDRTWIHNE